MSSVVAIASLAVTGQPVSVIETERELPVAADVDVVVVGGTAAGVSAAIAAVDVGASVFLAAERPFLGDDVAGTLELACDPTEDATTLERILIADESGNAPYSFDYERGFRFFGGWAYVNEKFDKLSIAGLPMTDRDSVLFTNEASVVCTLFEQEEIADLEVMVLENSNRTRPAFVSVDHRGAIADGPSPGPLSGVAEVEIIDGPQAGRVVTLERIKRMPLASEVIRKGDVGASPGANVLGDARKEVVIYRAPMGARFRKARVRVAPARGAACQLLSRIHFKRPAVVQLPQDPSPLKVKRTFDKILLEKHVGYMTGSPLTDLLVDELGVVSGIVIANRSGRQAVRAKCVVDASTLSVVSRLGKPIPGVDGAVRFSRVIISGGRPEAPGVSVKRLADGRYVDHMDQEKACFRGFESSAVTGRVWRCEFELPMADGGYAAFAAAEWKARELIQEPSVFDAADQLVLRQPMRPVEERAGLLTTRSQMSLGDRIREGEKIGRAAAKAARERKVSGRVTVDAREADAPADGDVRELLGGLRPYDGFKKQLGKVKSPTRTLPVIGEYDVVVVGGGTAGVPAAIGAGRSGARTLLVEYLYTLGGVSTDGMITGYYDGNHCGFLNEYKRRLEETDGLVMSHRIERTFHRMLDESGVTVWLGSFGAGAYVRNGRVKGVVIATPQGRGVVLAKSVIDGTGSADIAVAAGAQTTFIDETELVLQSAGQAPHRLGRNCINTDFGYVNDADAWDLWLFGVRSRAGAQGPWDVQQLVDSRERRRIVPDLRVEGWDVVYGRKFSDTVNRSKSRQDSHGVLRDEYGTVAEVDGVSSRYVNLPLRAYLPKGIGGLAVIGLGKGVARDVVPMTRMRADMTNEGYALGLCAAQAAANGDGEYRGVNVKEIQAKLVKAGNLPVDVLSWKEDPELTDEEVARAVAGVAEGYRGSGYVMRYKARSLPMLRVQYAKAHDPSARQAYAILLGLLGDDAGVGTLVALADGRQPFARLRNGISYCGQAYDKMGLAIALGRTKSPAAGRALVRWLERVESEGLQYVAVREVVQGLCEIGDRTAAPVLAKALQRPGIGGWACGRMEDLVPLGGYGRGPEMELCLRELALVRALLACGDCEGLARRTLEKYAQDPRGTLAEHANAVLACENVK